MKTLALLALCVQLTAAHATVFQCVSADGATTYQDFECKGPGEHRALELRENTVPSDYAEGESNYFTPAILSARYAYLSNTPPLYVNRPFYGAHAFPYRSAPSRFTGPSNPGHGRDWPRWNPGLPSHGHGAMAGNRGRR